MNLRVRVLAVGLATFIPGVKHLTSRRTGGTVSGRYCYAVWLRYLVKAHACGLSTHPRVVAELGPGDSLGVGMAALISGADRYYGFDVVRYADAARNLAVFDEIVALFQRRADIPDAREFPLVRPLLDDYTFPHEILTEERLAAALHPERLATLRHALASLPDAPAADDPIQYFAPSYDLDALAAGSVDMVFSQTVMEYPEDLHGTYRALYRWLAPGGYMAHDIDFSALGTANYWNGHWAYSDWLWNALCGRRRYRLANRQPHSTHLSILRSLGMTIARDEPVRDHSGLTRDRLAPRFATLTDEDLITRTAFILAVKPSDRQPAVPTVADTA